jgi:hypothetical protein
MFLSAEMANPATCMRFTLSLACRAVQTATMKKMAWPGAKERSSSILFRGVSLFRGVYPVYLCNVECASVIAFLLSINFQPLPFV